MLQECFTSLAVAKINFRSISVRVLSVEEPL